MARKRFSDEDVLNLLRQIDLELASGADVQSACRKVGVSDATYEEKFSMQNGSQPLNRPKSSLENG